MSALDGFLGKKCRDGRLDFFKGLLGPQHVLHGSFLRIQCSRPTMGLLVSVAKGNYLDPLSLEGRTSPQTKPQMSEYIHTMSLEGSFSLDPPTMELRDEPEEEEGDDKGDGGVKSRSLGSRVTKSE